MTLCLRLSQVLREHVEELHQPDEEFDAEEHQEEEKIVRSIMRYLLRSREGFSDAEIAKWNALFEKLEDKDTLDMWLDEYYVHDMLERIPKMVRRTKRFSTIVPNRTPSKEINLYLREATRCYIFGFWHASVSLCRATVEQALRERVNGKPSDRFYEMLKVAQVKGLVDSADAHMAEKAYATGRDVLHGKRLSEGRAADLAFDALSGARGVLIRLFSAR